MDVTRAICADLDVADPLAKFRERFHLPTGVIYLDGNSLGPLPRDTPARIAAVVEQEWGRDLITSWNRHDWINMPRRIGDKIGRLIGAASGEVIVTDSTSVDLFKVLSVALRARPDRRVVLSEADNFPTDLYIVQGLAELLDKSHELRLVKAGELSRSIDSSVAAVLLTQVNYRTGAMHDMRALTKQTQEHGALAVWDLAHSAGAFRVDLTEANADFAVGCGYKYLNGGPGAPAFLYAAMRHQAGFGQPIAGWMGHAAPFAFNATYQPAPGIERYLSGTPPILSLAALEAGIDLMLDADIGLLRDKSQKLIDLFIQLVADTGVDLVTSRDAAARGSQVSFRHEHGYAIVQALIARGVIGDFRMPDILRFGMAPLYLRYVDIWEAAAALRDILATRSWDRPEYHKRVHVT
jgi:kynureninase